MIEIVSFRRTINWKKVVIVILVLLLFIGIGIYFLLRNMTSSDPISHVSDIIKSNDTTLFVDNTNRISLTLPKKYGLGLISSDENHILTLKSPKNLYVLIAFEEKPEGFEIKDLITKDRDSYISNYENVSNVSEVMEDLKGYYYSFDYTNSGLDYTLETTWLKADNGYYLIDINYQKALLEEYKDIRSNVLNSISFIENNNGEAN